MAEVHLLVPESERPVTTRIARESAETWFREQLEASVENGYRLAAVILGDAVEAEDVTHDALERAWRARRSLRDPERFSAWFGRILVNACRDRLRRRRSTPVLVSLDSVGARANTATEMALTDPHGGDAQRDALRRALDRLGPDQRIVIVLRFFLDLEVEAIADRLGMRPGTVKSRLHRGLRELRAAWDANEREATRAAR